MNSQSSSVTIRPLKPEDLAQATNIWNAIIEAGDSFPDDRPLTGDEARTMFAAQTRTACALAGGRVAGVYILHPNHVGRCGHIANASFGVAEWARGRGIGRQLVEDCLQQASLHGFRGLQFNAVVSSNTPAIALYLRLGFEIVGTVRGGYRYRDGTFRDMLIFLKALD